MRARRWPAPRLAHLPSPDRAPRPPRRSATPPPARSIFSNPRTPREARPGRFRPPGGRLEAREGLVEGVHGLVEGGALVDGRGDARLVEARERGRGLVEGVVELLDDGPGGLGLRGRRAELLGRLLGRRDGALRRVGLAAASARRRRQRRRGELGELHLDGLALRLGRRDERRELVHGVGVRAARGVRGVALLVEPGLGPAEVRGCKRRRAGVRDAGGARGRVAVRRLDLLDRGPRGLGLAGREAVLLRGSERFGDGVVVGAERHGLRRAHEARRHECRGGSEEEREAELHGGARGRLLLRRRAICSILGFRRR
mmetsp:Transcript_30386/g.99493  ORF Transcript_30386/g.99493 Transcript_30386/m.99493 type:complete len:314 (-) Transcript_30386:739-1680(-)